jgi:alkaline phosphatase D
VGITRRSLIAAGVAAATAPFAATRIRRAGAAPHAVTLPPRVDNLPENLVRTWVGAPFWANRLGDWRLSDGRIECVATPAESGGRTVSLLTHDLQRANTAATITVCTGTLAAGTGFSGFLVGAGGGLLDHRAGALVQRASGQGGGILCVYGTDGHVRFREHTSETSQLAYAELPASARSGPAPARTVGEAVLLTLEIVPLGSGRSRLVLTARAAAGEALRSTAAIEVVDAAIAGGLALMSSSHPGTGPARFWFRELRAGGPRVGLHPERALGPILGTLWSLNGPVLKLSAQLFPIASTEPQSVRLEVRPAGSPTWQLRATAPVGPGWVAQFRIAGWDPSRAWEYRVVHAAGTPADQSYAGKVPADPVGVPELRIGVLNCTIHSYRPLDRASNGRAQLPEEHDIGLYTPANLYFPYAELSQNLAAQQPHLMAALGDQFYENRPTAKFSGPSPELDFLYRYSMWLWAFRDLTRDRPTIVMVDDHDVLQGNLWGHEGAAAPGGDPNRGGYALDAAAVNLIQRVQCGHDPDPFDPTPVQRGIGVYYCSFRYGGVSFAVVEDRKFKTGDADGRDGSGRPFPPSSLQLLGSRQHSFLTSWASEAPGLPKVCFTQSLFGCLQTNASGAMLTDHDSNGYPAASRTATLRLIRQAKALMVSGDQHLASVVRHGLDVAADGPVQMVSPPGGTSFQRWFEPSRTLPNPQGTRHTGDVVDGFGNRMRILAVANPKIGFARYRQGYPAGQGLADRSLKRDGYGLIRVNRAAKAFRLESWGWDVDPRAPGAAPFAGWPVTVPFSQA